MSGMPSSLDAYLEFNGPKAMVVSFLSESLCNQLAVWRTASSYRQTPWLWAHLILGTRPQNSEIKRLIDSDIIVTATIVFLVIT